jgi:hypothetical protein
MTGTRVVTSTRKIVAIGVPPGLLLNLRLQSYIVSVTESSKISKAQSRRVNRAVLTGSRCGRATEHSPECDGTTAGNTPYLRQPARRTADTASGFTKKSAVNPGFIGGELPHPGKT